MKELSLKMLFNREIALFWDFIEKDFVRSEISSLMKIRTVSHEAWQVFKFQIFKTLMKTIAKMIKNRIKDDVLKFCYEFYRNSWFLVKKKEKEKYRLINVALKMNRVIIRDANLFSAIDEFFWRVCRLCNRLVSESVLWIRSIVVNWEMSRYDRFHDFVWFDENDNDFHENDQFCDLIRSNDQ